MQTATATVAEYDDEAPPYPDLHRRVAVGEVHPAEGLRGEQGRPEAHGRPVAARVDGFVEHKLFRDHRRQNPPDQ